MRTLLTSLVVIALALGATGPATAHIFPEKAKSLKASLVQGYDACTTPDTSTNGGKPACSDTDPIDPDCAFDVTEGKGSGQLKATIKDTDVIVKATVKGLSAFCDGKTLTVRLGVRTTTDDCPGDHCTVADDQLEGGTCVVADGKCTISAVIPSGYPLAAASEMTILSCGVRNQTDDRDSFACGLMVP